MENNHQINSSDRRNPLSSFFLIIAFAVVGLFIGNFLGLLAILPFFDFDLSQTTTFLSDPLSSQAGRVPLLLVQGVTSVAAFIIAPLLYMYYYERRSQKDLLLTSSPIWPSIVLTLLITQAFMFVNTPIIEWNMNINLPEFMNSFELWAQQQEQYLNEITQYVTHFDDLPQLILGLIVIAIIPGVGEELLFRGLIQRKLSEIFKNPHIAIWVAGFLFGLFHFQFYGLVPRMLLGVLFGYLYWWSGSLMLAMLAHFFNNGFTLIMVYLYQRDLVSFDIDGSSEITSTAILIFGLVFGMLLYYFFKLIRHQPLINE